MTEPMFVVYEWPTTRRPLTLSLRIMQASSYGTDEGSSFAGWRRLDPAGS